MYELIHANCIDALRNMPDKSVDCVVTDMPYGVGVDFGDYVDNVENLKTLIADALPEMRRVARRVVLTPGVRNLFLYPQPTWTLGWFFGGGARGRWGFNHWQPVLVYGADPLHRLNIMHTDVIRATNAALEDRSEHPCPKPLPFLRKLINRVAPSPADVILDPFMGSGTTGVAAIQLGHKFIGVEVNGDYLAIAKRRIAQASPDFTQTIELIIEKGTIRRV
jgi:site-specific DNA-methyltransferase (adenine-specific)